MKKKIITKDLVLAAMLIALSIVFAEYLSLSVGNTLRIGFGQTPIILSGLVLGPIWGLAVGMISDVVGFAINPRGPFTPFFTIISGLIGLIPGLIRRFWLKDKVNLAIIISSAICCLFVNAVLGTFVLSYFFSMRSFVILFPTRLVSNLVMTIIHSIILIAILKYLKPILPSKK